MEQRRLSREERWKQRAQRQKRRKLLLFGVGGGAVLLLVLLLLLTKCGGNKKPDDGGSQSLGQAVQPVSGDDSAARNYVICIDPGHGYDDGGTVSDLLGDLAEKDIALDISLKLREQLEALGFTVVMTRDSDQVPADMEPKQSGLYIFSAKDRPEVINALSPDLSISIHCNACEESDQVRGICTYYYEGNHPEVTPLYAGAVAGAVQKVFSLAEAKVSAMNRSDAFYLVRDVTAPALLIETGFVTNAEDAALLLSEQWRSQMAQAIAQGIEQFYQEQAA